MAMVNDTRGNTTNNSTGIFDPRGDLTSFLQLIRRLSIGLDIVMCIGIVIFNCLVLTTVLSSSSLRKELRYMLVVSLCVADLLVGITGVPILIDFGIQEKITVVCEVHVVIQALLLYAHVLITSVGLLIISIDYVKKQYNFRLFTVSRPKQLPVYIFLSVLPWLLMVVLVTPLCVRGLHHLVHIVWSDTRCPLFLSKWATWTLLIVCYYLPMSLTLLLTCFIIKGWIALVRGTVAFQPSLLNEERPIMHPKYLIIINLTCFVLQLPIHIVNNRIKIEPLQTALIIFFTSFQLSLLKSVLIPAIWLCTPEIREEFKQKVKRIFIRKSNAPQNLVNKSYREFVEGDENTQQ